MNYLVRSRIGIVVAACFSLCISTASFAELPEFESEPPELPEARANSVVAGRLINSSNVLEYKSLLPPELFSWVQAGEISIDAIKDLDFVWRFDDGWYSAPKQREKFTLLADGGLNKGVRLSRGFAFDVKEILNEDAPVLSRGYKALWNAHSTMWSQAVLDSEFELEWFVKGKKELSLRATLSRVYPTLLDKKDKTIQLFREKLQVVQPVVLSALSWLTFRFRDSTEDYYWFASPTIQKTRRLTGSNRSDSILRTPLSLDDLFVWSGTPTGVQPYALESKTYLSPSPSFLLTETSETSAKCLSAPSTDSTNNTERVARGGEDSKVLNSWWPEGVVFSPRKFLRIEVGSEDPFSQYGRQTIYIDQETMIPVYKFVYDRSGNLWKRVIGGVGLMATKDRRRKVPYHSFLLVQDYKKEEVSFVRFLNYRVCEELPKENEMSEYDPKKLIQASSATGDGES